MADDRQEEMAIIVFGLGEIRGGKRKRFGWRCVMLSSALSSHFDWVSFRSTWQSTRKETLHATGFQIVKNIQHVGYLYDLRSGQRW